MSNPPPALSLSVATEPHDSPDAVALQEALSAELKARFGSDGKAGFAGFGAAAGQAGAVFAVARDVAGHPVGCGALLRGEIKRMYASQPGRGIGAHVLAFLEAQARIAGYSTITLSTRHANTAAVAFYRARGFIDTPNYGPYATRPECICLAKPLP
jgi:ribosomal protein S18 acetylase RimI-like enzyme